MNAAALGVALFGLVIANPAFSQSAYPNKPIRIVTAGVGSSADFASRLIGLAVSESLGQRVVVDNRGSGVIPGELVARAPADGHTLLLMGTTFWLAPFLRADTPYDPIADFEPITLAGQVPNVLVVHTSLPVRSVGALIKLAKAKPAQLNYYSGGSGATNHLAAELFNSMAGVKIVRIPYKNSAQGLADLVAGQVHLSITAASAAMPYVRSDRLRALAVASARRTALVPDLPTIAETLPGYEAVTFNAIFAPARTPPPVVKRLNEEIVKALHRPDIKKKFFDSGVEVVGNSPGELHQIMKAEMSRMGQLIRNQGIKAD